MRSPRFVDQFRAAANKILGERWCRNCNRMRPEQGGQWYRSGHDQRYWRCEVCRARREKLRSVKAATQ